VRDSLDDQLRRRIDHLQETACPRQTTLSRRLAALKQGLSVVILSAAVLCAQMYVLVLLGYFALVIAVGNVGKWCLRRIVKLAHGSVEEIQAERRAYGASADGDDIVVDSDSEDDVYAEEPSPPSTSRSAAKRNYLRASFNSGLHRDAADDTSMITESLLGDAEIDEDGNIEIDSHSLRIQRSVLMNSNVVPRTAKYGMPILYAMTFMLFLSSNLSNGATINVRAFKQDVGEPIGAVNAIIPEVYVFSLVGTVSNMWRAGVYNLALVILLFSGIWPYIKVTLMWIAWAAPCDTNARGSTLKILDAFGKWSLVDAFVMMLFMVLFHFQVKTTPDVVGYGDLTVSVYPARGFFVFLMATILSMAIGHVTTVYQRMYDEQFHRASAEAVSVNVERSRERKVIWRRLQKNSLLIGMGTFALLVANTVMLIFGWFAIGIRFTFLGVAGAALGPDASVRTISLSSMAKDVRNASPDLSPALSRLIEWLMLIFALGVPLLCRLTTIALWMVPMNVKEMKSMWLWRDFIEAWSALDVMLFSFVAAITQIRQFLAFMIGGGKCATVNEALQQFVSGPLHSRHDLCFDVDSSISSGTWLLLGCIVFDYASVNILQRVYAAVDGNVDDSDVEGLDRSLVSP
jgi:hypothetical protein